MKGRNQNEKKPVRYRERDSFIMDNILRMKWSERKVDTINKVRLYLKVERMSEIANPEGTRIDEAWLSDQEKPSRSTALWPVIRRPSQKMWRTWKNAIRRMTQQDGQLRPRLGK